MKLDTVLISLSNRDRQIQHPHTWLQHRQEGRFDCLLCESTRGTLEMRRISCAAPAPPMNVYILPSPRSVMSWSGRFLLAHWPDFQVCNTGLEAFEFPLAFTTATKFNQPIFSCNNLTGENNGHKPFGTPFGLKQPFDAL